MPTSPHTKFIRKDIFCTIFAILSLIKSRADVGIGPYEKVRNSSTNCNLILYRKKNAQNISLFPPNFVGNSSCEKGFVVETVTYGYADEIHMLIGVSKEGRVTGLVVADAHETLGLGSRILTDHVFLSQFLNGTGAFAAATADAFSGSTGEAETGEETQVDAISGATVSSKAVIRCVNSAIAYVTGADVSSGATSWGG